MTENTTASGATDLPEFPGHPEPQIMTWSALEIVAIRKYGADMFKAGRLAAPAPVAPAQPAPMPYPTDAQIDAVYEQTMGQHLRSQDAPAVRRFGRAMFLCAWNAATEAAPITDAEQAAWHAGIDEGRSQAARGAAQAAQAAPSMDAKQLGDAVVKWLGCETTKPRGDTGEPERRIDVSVERLGFAVAALIAARGAAQPEGGA